VATRGYATFLDYFWQGLRQLLLAADLSPRTSAGDPPCLRIVELPSVENRGARK